MGTQHTARVVQALHRRGQPAGGEGVPGAGRVPYAVHRLDGQTLGWLRALARAGMICLVLPTVVIGAERRALNDLVLVTVVVNRR